MKKHSVFNRIISLVLSLVLVASCLPAGMFAAKAATGESGIVGGSLVTDPYTLNAWKDTAFNPYDLTTEHAGGVWTDKSVLTVSDIATAFPNVSGLTVADNNFLVALSALGANSVIAGQGTTPTDTIFVLDVSNSMENSDLTAMVTATNDSIHTLLQANPNNRVGVVVYATDVDILLPLDRYTPVTKTSWYGPSETAYIEMSNDYSNIRTARVTTGGSFYGGGTTYVKNSAGQNVTKSISASGATYIQGGLWEAYEMFEGATVSDTRTPVLVLMSDGAPTYGTEDFNDVSSRDVGSGGTGSVTDGLAFLTQLTAAYVKEMIADKYGTTAYLYSVGLGVSESGQQVSVAEAVLDTSKTRTNIESNWTTYLGLANAQNKTMRFNAAGENVTVTYDAVVTEDSKNYTNRYFPASDASQLGAAFKGIVNEINLKASYNVTRLEGIDVNTGGYVTFVDEIGTGMEVKDIKGILIGNHLFSGEMLAKATADGDFGTEAAPTALGLNQIWALQNRLRMEATDTQTAEQRVWELLRQARNVGQISYSANSYSNYVGWFGDANGKFVGFWDTEDETPVIPAGATHANMCYGMLGTTTDSQTAHASDMMYVAITVSKAITDGEIKDNTPQIVTFRIPASLLPTITYQIDVQAANDEEITENTPATITYNPAEPIRLLYEVGVHSKLNALNIQDFLREGYQAKDADGNYYLYTNAWYWEPSDGSAADFSTPPTKDNAIGKDVLYDTAKNHITYAYFEPGVENEHYYYTEDTAIYTRSGNTYTKLTTAPVTDGSVQYYFQHKVYEATATQTGVAVDANVEIHYGKVSPKLLQTAANIGQGDDGVYYIKEGTMHYETIHDHDREKASNDTGSFLYRLHQLVDIAVSSGENSHHYEIAYLGNNGRITYAPAQGLKITKEMADGSTPDATFFFEVALTAPAGQTLATEYETVHVARNGTETKGSANVVGGKLTVSLMPGESVYIVGLPTDTEYTVTELDAEGYRLDSARDANGVVANNTISEAVFTNVVQKYGALTVSKWVTYQDGVVPTADNNEFDVTVTLTEGTENFVGNVTLDGQTQTVTNGKVTFKIKHGQQVVIGNIPEGVQYAVAEDKTTLPAGYTWENEGAAILSGTMDADGQVAQLTNTYDPADHIIDASGSDLFIRVDKNLQTNNTLGGAFRFNFVLQRYDPAAGTWTDVDSNYIAFGNLAEGEHNWTDIALEATGERLTAVGEYYFRLAEAPGIFPGMTYDRIHQDFKVVVTDKDLDGKLEIDDVVAVDDTVTVTYHPSATNPDASYWAVRTTFHNRYETYSTKLTLEAKKTLTNTLTNENVLKDGQFEFALYQTDDTFDITGKTPVTVRNGANGDIVFPTGTYPYIANGPDYYYVMKEVSTNGNGVTVDPTVWEICVDVSYPDSGEASVDKVMWREQGQTDWTNQVNTLSDNVFNEIIFENTYTPASVKAEITANKTLTNRTSGTTPTAMQVPANTFSFKLQALGNAPMPASNTAYAAQGGAVLFDEIIFTEAGVYSYKVTEQDTSVPGVTKDSAAYTAVVTVTDDGLGRLHAEVSYLLEGIHTQGMVFNNIYAAAPTGDIVLGGTKAWTAANGTDRDLKVGEFAFTLTRPDGTTETVTNTENGGNGFKFSPVSFDAAGSYEFTIKEVVPHAAVNNALHGITYDVSVKTVTVIVTDNGSGVLQAGLENASLSLGQINQVVTFENRYEAAPETIALTAHKDLVGRELNPSEFTFRIEAITNGAPMPVNDVVTNNENGDVTFEEMTFSAVGVYQYRITELDENNGALTDGYTHNGVTYCQKVYTVTVTVRDSGNGKLVAHVASVDENGDAQPGGVVFTNVYKAASVKVRLEGDDAATDGKIFTDESSLPENKKTLDDYEFEFVLSKTGGEIVQTVVDNGAGFTFDEIEFDTAGEYVYLIYERPTGQPGVIFDYAKYKVTVTVTDDGNGQLEADVKYEKASSGESDDYQTVDGVLFENSYKAKEVTVSFSGTKTLTGRALKDKEFSFILKDAKSGETITTVMNDAQGKLLFPSVTYNAEGTFTYLLEEKIEAAEGITYDKTQYLLTVVVEDENGQLKATVTVTAENKAVEEIAFENTFTPEKTPEKDPDKEPEKTPEIDSPKTGDDFVSGPWTLMMVVSAVGLLAVLLLGRKKEQSAE